MLSGFIKIAWFKPKSDVIFDIQIEIQCAIGGDSAICHEWYVLGELDLDEFRPNNKSLDQDRCNTKKITFYGLCS